MIPLHCSILIGIILYTERKFVLIFGLGYYFAEGDVAAASLYLSVFAFSCDYDIWRAIART
jgi:hypothetical protein